MAEKLDSKWQRGDLELKIRWRIANASTSVIRYQALEGNWTTCCVDDLPGCATSVRPWPTALPRELAENRTRCRCRRASLEKPCRRQRRGNNNIYQWSLMKHKSDKLSPIKKKVSLVAVKHLMPPVKPLPRPNWIIIEIVRWSELIEAVDESHSAPNSPFKSAHYNRRRW